MKQPPRINKIPAPKAAKDIAQRQKKDNAKSRSRLIGSITILIIITLFLIRLTSNIKPLPINPNVVDIQSTNTVESNSTQLLAPTAVNASMPIAENTKNSASEIITHSDNPELILNDEVQPNTGFKAGIVAKEPGKNTSTVTNAPSTTTQATATQTTKKVVETVAAATADAIITNTNNTKTTPQPVKEVKENIVVKPVKAKPTNNPEDILNGSDDGDLLSTAIKNKSAKNDSTTKNTPATNKEYIQLAALSSIEKANSLKQELAAKGVNASIQTIETPKGTLYRLKAGPYTTDVAKTKLQQLNNNGYTGIITTK